MVMPKQERTNHSTNKATESKKAQTIHCALSVFAKAVQNKRMSDASSEGESSGSGRTLFPKQHFFSSKPAKQSSIKFKMFQKHQMPAADMNRKKVKPQASRLG